VPSRTYAHSLLFSLALALLIPHSSRAQSTRPTPHLLARVSYNSTYVHDISVDSSSPAICFEVYDNGDYRISRLTQGRREVLAGNLDREQLVQFTAILKRLKEQSPDGGIVRYGSESLVAEMVLDGRTTRYIWFNPDQQRPFPEQAVTLIGWLQTFNACSPLVFRVSPNRSCS
jgi:hypothetical protein